MSGNCGSSSAGEIRWHLLDDGARKSGIKIVYSMSDEITFAKKYSIMLRKEAMRQLMENETQMYKQELNSIGLLHYKETTCEGIRKCSRDHNNRMRKYSYDAHKSNMEKLMRMSVD